MRDLLAMILTGEIKRGQGRQAPEDPIAVSEAQSARNVVAIRLGVRIDELRKTMKLKEACASVARDRGVKATTILKRIPKGNKGAKRRPYLVGLIEN